MLYRKYKEHPPSGEVPEFDIHNYYTYDFNEQLLRTCYSVALICIHIKIMNVLSFYQSIAFLIKLFENLVGAVVPFLGFFSFIVLMFTLAFWALDMVYPTMDV